MVLGKMDNGKNGKMVLVLKKSNTIVSYTSSPILHCSRRILKRTPGGLIQKLRFSGRGMTLIEVALVLVILGLLAGMSLPLVTELTKQRHYRSTQRDLEEIKEALAGYAGIYGRLPAPDTNGDGRADANQLTGTLPYLDLGLGAVDSAQRLPV